MTKRAFIFPGQGAQYPGMGKSFFANYDVAKETFQEADDLLKMSLSKLMFEGPTEELTKTSNSQLAIFVMSVAVFRTVQALFSDFVPAVTSGLSLGEYTALYAGGHFSFREGLQLVYDRGTFMSEACVERPGTMAAVLGMKGEQVDHIIEELNLPDQVWVANYNCPGQVVISGTVTGIEKGVEALKQAGARRVMPLQVHGAFHSGLMASAEKKLAHSLENVKFQPSTTALVMNVPGDFVEDVASIPTLLQKQVTHPVRWEQGVQAMQRSGVELFVEMGCGKVLTGLNKKIGVVADTLSIDHVDDLQQLEARL